jgi:O-antigen/teichoic acid export membrane protein
VTTWVLGVPLVLAFGQIGYALANLGVLATHLLLFRVARAQVELHLVTATLPIWLWAGSVGVLVHLATRVYPCTSLVALGGYLAAGGMLYFAGLALLAPRELRQVWEWTRGKA